MTASFPRFQDIPLLKEFSQLVARQKELEYLNIQGPLNEETAELGKTVQSLSNDIFKLTSDLFVCKEMHAAASSEFLNLDQLSSTSTSSNKLLLAKEKHADAESELTEIRHEMRLANNTLSSLRQQNVLLEFKLQKEVEEDKRIVEKTAADLERMQHIISDIPILVKAEKKKLAVEELNNTLHNLSLKEVELKENCTSLRLEIEQSSKVPVTTFVRNLARICAQRSSTLSKMTEIENELRKAHEKLDERRRSSNDVLNVTMLEDFNCTTMCQSQPSSPASQETTRETTDVAQTDDGRSSESQTVDGTSQRSRQSVLCNTKSLPVETVEETSGNEENDDDMDSSDVNASFADEPMEDGGDEENNPCNETSAYEEPDNTTIGEESMDDEKRNTAQCHEELVETANLQDANGSFQEQQESTQGLSDSFHTGLTQTDDGSAFDCLQTTAPAESSQAPDAAESAFELSAFQISQDASPFDMFSTANADDGADTVLNISQNSNDAGADFLAFMNSDKPTENASGPDFSFSKEFCSNNAGGDSSAGGFDFNFGGSSPTGGADFNFDFNSNTENTDGGDSFNFNF